LHISSLCRDQSPLLLGSRFFDGFRSGCGADWSCDAARSIQRTAVERFGLLRSIFVASVWLVIFHRCGDFSPGREIIDQHRA
jgi:hypothetical protein